MKILEIYLKLLPRSDHPKYYDIGGAFFAAYLPDEPEQSALDRVTQILTLLRWDVAEVRGIHRVSIGSVFAPLAGKLPSKRLPLREPDFEPVGHQILPETFFFGLSFHISFFSPGGEEELSQLEPPHLEDLSG